VVQRQPAAAPPAPAAAVDYSDAGHPHASPLARRIAERFGVDLRGLEGSGPGGRIVAADVEAVTQGQPPAAASVPAPAAAPTAPAGAPETTARPETAPLPEGAEDIAPTRLRQAIARRMAESKRNAPHFYVSVDIDAGKLLALRARLNRGKARVSVNDLLVKALALAAVEHPNVNTAYIGDKVRHFSRIDVGIAVATENGLLSPAILDCAGKTVAKISEESRDLTERARAGHLKPEEYGGGTITLSNLGMYGITSFLAILNPPQAVIVSVGAAADRVVVRAAKPAVGKVMTAWAAADHRVLDGAEVARFMATFRELVEDPGRLSG
jgi:pyruvate dehydrogenase E2 component (dihydrolipoamide acetyltransferase)